MGKTIRIGIDFGTSYSFAGFQHGDFVMPLIPAKERYGIPSVFYYDGTSKLVGRMAEKRGKNKPDCVVYSIKRNLGQKAFSVGGRVFSVKEVVKEIISYIIQCAEEQLKTVYMEEYDSIEAVITVPVEFLEPELNLIREAASEVVLGNGTNLQITGVLKEPVAAAIEYFGMKKEEKINILVYDLGGGTFDTALVCASPEGEFPYKVIDQDGDRKLGGDDWDRMLAVWMAARYRETFQTEPSFEILEQLLREAKTYKEDLTEVESVNDEVMIEGEYLPVEITRAEFENLTKPLLDRSLMKLKRLLERNPDTKIDHVILTGGSSYMPQVKKALESCGLFEKGTDILLVEPEHAIAYGAARFATTRRADAVSKKVVVEKKLIELRATHSYGILYSNYKTKTEFLGLFIYKGDKLPISVKKHSATGYENHRKVVFKIYESDYDGKEKFIEASKGHQIMSVTMMRKEENVPAGTISEDTMSLTEDGMLTFESKDIVSGMEVKKMTSVKRTL